MTMSEKLQKTAERWTECGVWHVDTGRPKEPCIRWVPGSPTGRGTYRWHTGYACIAVDILIVICQRQHTARQTYGTCQYSLIYAWWRWIIISIMHSRRKPNHKSSVKAVIRWQWYETMFTSKLMHIKPFNSVPWQKAAAASVETTIRGYSNKLIQ